MFALRITFEDGTSRVIPIDRPTVCVGRDPGNDVVLPREDVSAWHCSFEFTPTHCWLTERGSRNGTWLNNRPLTGSAAITCRDRIYVGTVLLELVAAASVRRPMFDRILRDPPGDRASRVYVERLHRYAQEWDRSGRTFKLALRGRELVAAQAWLGRVGPGEHVGRLEREFIAASARACRRRTQRTVGLGIVGAASVIAAATVAWSSMPVPASSAVSVAAPDPSPPAVVEPPVAPAPVQPSPEPVESGPPIEHRVVPLETLDDIARRYGVSTQDIIDWNLLNPSAPDLDGRTLTIRHPKRSPLPQQLIHYDVEPGDTWTKLAQRFDVPATRLQAYNEAVELEPGARIDVWVDPRPYVPRVPARPITKFEADRRAVSVGKPTDGRLEQGMRLPESDLYLLRSPNYVWGSSYTVTALQTAVATFRRDVDYNGELIIGDISRRPGGHFDPHKSHQAGRDVDIWLPTIAGVYKTKFLQSGDRRPRRPARDEVDWYATWGLVRALIQTGAVQYIFLDHGYQKFIYDAAVNMKASPEELELAIQYPDKATSTGGILRHADDHFSHIHVRFKCAPWETECTGSTGAFVE